MVEAELDGVFLASVVVVVVVVEQHMSCASHGILSYTMMGNDLGSVSLLNWL